MFIKTCTRKMGDKKYKTHYLAEGYRDKETGKVKHRHILSLSKMPAKQILALKASLAGSSKIEKIKLEDLEVMNVKEYGSVKVFEKLFDKYFGKSLDQKYYSEIKKIVINKIFNPKSKNALNNWLREVELGNEIINKDRLYESLDYLESNQKTIEKKLAAGKKKQEVDLLLYDITSTYFEGKGAENLCKNGYSRDHRSDRVQVNIGLVTTSDGTPLCTEVFAGNVNDKSTLKDKIDSIKEKFGIRNITFVFDRGMKTKANLEYLKEQGYDYITALSHAELRKKAEENERIQMGLFDKKDLVEFEIEDKKYALSHNKSKATNDNLTRIKLIEKTEKLLKNIQNLKKEYTVQELQNKVSKIINRYRCEKYLSYDIKENGNIRTKKENQEKIAKLFFKRNKEAIKNHEQYDGFYMVESTKKELSGEEAEKKYKSLQLVERAFDCVKNHIEIRPVFHYKETRIKGHIFSCFMSYYLLHKFKQQTKELLKSNTLDELLTELKCIKKVNFKIDKFVLEKINTLTDIQKELFSIFQIRVL